MCVRCSSDFLRAGLGFPRRAPTPKRVGASQFFGQIAPPPKLHETEEILAGCGRVLNFITLIGHCFMFQKPVQIKHLLNSNISVFGL